MSEKTIEAARAICSRNSMFCRNVGGELGCPVGRGTSDHTKCIATVDQLFIAGHMTTAEKVEAIISPASNGEK